MARKPHLKTSFDPEILEGLVERAKQAEMKSPQDYVRYLVQRDDEDMGVHVCFEEREKLQQQLDYANKDIKEKEGALENYRKFADEIRTVCNVPKTDFIKFDDLSEKVKTLRQECGVLKVSRDHWKKEFEHQKKERETAQADVEDHIEHYRVVVNEFSEAFGVKEGESIKDAKNRQNEGIANTVRELNKYKSRFETLSGAVELIKEERDNLRLEIKNLAVFYGCPANGNAILYSSESLTKERDDALESSKEFRDKVGDLTFQLKTLKQDLSTTKADLKNTNAAAITNMKEIAITLGVPDTTEHIVQCIGELNQDLETAKSDRDKIANELKVMGDKWEVRYKELETDLKQWQSIGIALGVGPTYEKASQRIADLAFEPIYMVIWRRVRQFFAGDEPKPMKEKD